MRPERPTAAPPRLRLRWSAAIVAAVLAAPGAAEAHIRSGVVATDYRATVLRVPPAAVAATVYASDRAIGLTVARGHVASVLTSSGGSLLRIDARRTSRTAVWHDARLRGLPAGVQRTRWVVPLVLDGNPARVEGEIWRVRAPPSWPWLIVGLPFVAATAMLLSGSRQRLGAGATVFAGLAVTATVVIAVEFAASPSAAPGRLIEGFDELVFAAVGVRFLVRGTTERRMIAATALGLLALATGCLKIAVLGHGVVLSALPATAARGSVVLALWSGVAAVVAGAWLLADEPRAASPASVP